MKTILYPHTEIFSIRQFPLFLLSRRIRIFQPVAREVQSEALDSFMNAGFCQVEVPKPFTDKEQQSRFLRLMQDIRHRKDDYTQQLGELTLAAMSGQQEDGEHSRQAIEGSIRGRDKAAEDEHNRLHNEEWQAKMILAIGEILDREEEAIATELAILDDSTKELLEELQGKEKREENILVALRKIQRHHSPENLKNLEKRGAAWKRLFEENVKPADVLLTTSRDTVDLLTLEHEKLTGNTSECRGTLILPAIIAQSSERAVEKITRFADKNSRLLEQFNPASPDLQQTAAWNQAVEQTFPAAIFGSLKVEIMECGENTIAYIPSFS